MSIKLIDTIKPANNGEFPIVEAVDVKVCDDGTTRGKRLNDIFPTEYTAPTVAVPITIISQEDYDVLVSNEQVEQNKLYLVYESEEGVDT